MYREIGMLVAGVSLQVFEGHTDICCSGWTLSPYLTCLSRRIFEVFAVTFFFTRLICYGYVVYLLGLKLLQIRWPRYAENTFKLLLF
jgi:hypothetical protein